MQLRCFTHRDEWGQNTKRFVCGRTDEAQLIQHKQYHISTSISRSREFSASVLFPNELYICGVIYQAFGKTCRFYRPPTEHQDPASSCPAENAERRKGMAIKPFALYSPTPAGNYSSYFKPCGVSSGFASAQPVARFHLSQGQN